jgi:hypothetical protein
LLSLQFFFSDLKHLTSAAAKVKDSNFNVFFLSDSYELAVVFAAAAITVNALLMLLLK